MDDLDAFGRRQLGLVTTWQLRRAGWSRDQILHAVRVGRLIPVRRGVYRLAGAPVTRLQAWLAAVLAAGEDAVASHLTSVTLWGFVGAPAPDAIDVLVEGRTAPRLPGVRGHTTDSLPAQARSVVRRVPVTSPERSIIDSCGRFSERGLSSAVNDGLRRQILLLPRLARTVEQVPRSGRRAVVPIVQVLKTKIPGYDAGDSDPEVDLVETLAAAGLPTPQQRIRVETDRGTKFIDVGWPEVRIGFEYDSLEFHEHRFHEDRARLRALKRAGWDVWPITSTTTRNEILAIAALAFPQNCRPERDLLRESG